MSLIVPILLIILVMAIAGIVFQRHLKKRRLRVLCERPFPAEWQRYLEEKMEIYPRLPGQLKEELHRHTQWLVHTRSWEAAGGLEEITDEMKALIMAQAALLTIGRQPKKRFPILKSVILYPSTYSDSGKRQFSSNEEQRAMLGESWTSGSVVLSWNSVLKGAANEDDGKNVVIHEFAHQLDQADGVGDGAPILKNREEYRDWAEVFSKHYAELVDRTNSGRKTFLDKYGATNPAEFFAVATEAFFESRDHLKDKHPKLYSELKDYYQLDPAEW